jgi:hypothetical protein
MTKTKYSIRAIENTLLDEPVFLLCARDVTAPAVVREWAAQAARRGAPPSKTASAITIAEDMEAWQQAHPGRVKVPD